MKKQIVAATVVAGLLMASAYSHAAETAMRDATSRNLAASNTNTSNEVLDMATIPSPKEYNGVRYITGGVGEDEEAALKAQQSEYNLRLLVTAPDGAYESLYKVRLTKPSGETVLDITADGPYTFARLEPGTYTLTVEGEGKQKTRKIRVSRHGAQNMHIVI